MMFDSGMFLLSFDTDYIGWKHRAWCRVASYVCEISDETDIQLYLN